MASLPATVTFDSKAFLDEMLAYKARFNLLWLDVAALTGLNPRTLRCLVMGTRTPSLYSLAAIAGAMDLSMDKHVRMDRDEAVSSTA